MKKTKKILLLFITICLLFTGYTVYALTTNDVTGPVIENIELSAEEVSPGDILRITITATDESEIEEVIIGYTKGELGSGGGKWFYATKQEDGTFVGELEITEEFYNDYYRISTEAIDEFGNNASISRDALFKVTGGIDDITGPVIENVELSKKEVSPGDILKVTITVTDESELEEVSFSYGKEWSQDIKTIYAKKQEDGTYVGEIEITDKFFSDTYRISTSAYDIHGNSASISRDAVFKVTGGIDDITGPVIENVEVSSKVVSPGDNLIITITISDESEVSEATISYYHEKSYNGKWFYATKQEDGTFVGELEITEEFNSGYYSISANAEDEHGNSASRTTGAVINIVGAKNDITSLKLNKTEINMKKGEQQELEVTIDPADTTQNLTIKWTSSNEKIAKVDETGKITAVGIGSATITATSVNGKTATANVTVEKNLVYWNQNIGSYWNTSLNNYLKNETGIDTYAVTEITFNNIEETNLIIDESTSLYSADISKYNDKSVMVYIVDNTLYIQFRGTLVLNEKSVSLFAGFEYAKTLKGLEYIDTSNVKDMSDMFVGTRFKNLDLSSFNTSNVTNMSGMFSFSYYETLDLSSFNTSNVTNMSDMFRSISNLKQLDVSNFDTSNVTDMSGMFAANRIENIILGNFNTSKVTNMKEMFYNTIFKEINLSTFDTSRVIDMENMFAYAQGFKTIDLSNFNTSNVRNMKGMFDGANLTELDLSSFDTSNVTNMSFMFQSAGDEEGTGIIKLNLTSFNTSNVITMQGMFYNLILTELDLSSFNTSNVTDMSTMFQYTKLTELDLSSFNTSNVISMSGMFNGSSITKLNLSSFNTSNVTDMSSMFMDTKLTELDLSNFDTSKVEYMSGMFNGSSITKLDLRSFDTSKVQYMYGMFMNTQLTELNLSSFNTSNVTDMNEMFKNTLLTELDLSNFDTSKVEYMSGMFMNTNLTELDLSSFNTSNVTNMTEMFYESSITKLDLSNFDTTNVTDMSRMFYETDLIELNLSSFDTSKVKDFSYMFAFSKNLKKIYVSDLWNIDNLSNIDSMFLYCESLIGGNKTAYNYNYTNGDMAKIDSYQNKGYLSVKGTYESNKYDLSKPYIYISNNTFNEDDIIVSGNLTKSVSENKLYIKYKDLIINQYDIVSINSDEYDLSNDYIVTDGNFDKSLIKVINGTSEFENNKLIIKYGDITLQTYDILSPIKGITINEKDQSLKVGESKQLSATLNPETTTDDKTLTWKSSNENIVKVDNTGKLTAIGRGTATITVTTSNGKTDSFEITISEPLVTSLTVDETQYDLTIDSKEFTIEPKITTQDNPTYEIIWKSSNEKVVTVTNGTVKVMGTGLAKITVTALNKSVEIIINVTSPIKGITITEKVTSLKVGESKQLSATLNPETTTDDKTLTWKSSNENIVKVDNTGKLTAIGRGTATITVTTSNGKTDSFEIIISNPMVTSINIEKTQYDLRIDSKEFTIEPKITTQDNPTYEIIWKSSNEKVVTVTNGTVKVMGTGLAKITITALNKSVEIIINVTSPIKGITINEKVTSLKVGESKQLTATLNPETTTDDKTLTWKSSNENIVKVDNTGKLTAIGRGTATIIVTTSNGKTDSFEIIISNPMVTSINIEKTQYDLRIDSKEFTIEPKITTQDNPTYEIIWKSSNEKVVTVTNGTVKVMGTGLAKITITALNKSVEIIVNVTSPIKGVTITEKVTSLKVGESKQLSASLNPETTTDDKTLTWKSSNENIAKVDNTGKLTAIGRGTATIIVTTSNGKTDSFEITVDNKNPIFELVNGIVDLVKSVIKKILPNTTAKSIYDSIKNNENVILYDSDGNILCNNSKTSTEKIATGYYIEYISNGKMVHLDLSVTGDLSGDGDVDSLDLATMMNHISGRKELMGAYLEAAYLNNDEDIDSLDLAYLMNHIAGKEGY